MIVWLEVLLAPLLSLGCVVLAWRLRALRWLWMGVGIAGVALTLVMANDLSRRANGYLLSAAVPLIVVPFLSCQLSRMSRHGLLAAAFLATAYSGWMEFIAPAFARAELASLKTHFAKDGTCLQSTSYTCGPAAAVTALVRLGFPAEEGDLGLRARSSSHTGTDPDDLAKAIAERFGPDGARVEYRPLASVDQLQQAGLALTVIEYDSNIDHWVTVLAVNADKVTYADPISGQRKAPRAEFERKWRQETIRVWRQ